MSVPTPSPCSLCPDPAPPPSLASAALPWPPLLPPTFPAANRLCKAGVRLYTALLRAPPQLPKALHEVQSLLLVPKALTLCPWLPQHDPSPTPGALRGHRASPCAELLLPGLRTCYSRCREDRPGGGRHLLQASAWSPDSQLPLRGFTRAHILSCVPAELGSPGNRALQAGTQRVVLLNNQFLCP